MATPEGVEFIARTLNGWARYMRHVDMGWYRAVIFIPCTMNEQEGGGGGDQQQQMVCECHFVGHLVDVDESSFNSQRRGRHGILLAPTFLAAATAAAAATRMSPPLSCANCHRRHALSAVWTLKGLEDATDRDFSYVGRELVHAALEAGRSEATPPVHLVTWHQSDELSAKYAPNVAILPIQYAAHIRHSAARFEAQLDDLLGSARTDDRRFAGLLECGQGEGVPPTTVLDELMDKIAPPGDARVARERPFLYLVGRPTATAEHHHHPSMWPLVLGGGNYWLIVRNVRLAISWRGGHAYTITTIGGGGSDKATAVDAQEDGHEGCTMLTLGDTAWSLLHVPSTVDEASRVAILPPPSPLSSSLPPLVYFRGSREAITSRDGRGGCIGDGMTAEVRAIGDGSGAAFAAYRPSHHLTPIVWPEAADDAERMMGITNPSRSFLGDVFPTARAAGCLARVSFRCDQGSLTPWIREEWEGEGDGATGAFLEVVQRPPGHPPRFIVLFDHERVYQLEWWQSPGGGGIRMAQPPSPPPGLCRGWHLTVYPLTVTLIDEIDHAARSSADLPPMEMIARLLNARIPEDMPIDRMIE